MKYLVEVKKVNALVITMLLAGMFLVNSASAYESGTWQNEITLYGWATGIDGSVEQIDGDGTDITYDTSDILENLNAIFMGGYQGRFNRWSIMADLIYLDISDSGNTNTSVGTASAELGLKSWIVSGAIGYDLVQDNWGIVTFLGGVRYLGLETDSYLAIDGDQILDNSDSSGLTDGIIGLRGVFRLTDSWYIPYHADIGAGGSDLSYQLFAGIGYRYEWFDVRLGYRYMKYELEDDQLLQDLSLSGPQLGLGIVF